MSPVWQAIVFVGAQIVVGILGYVQGRRDEELHWRRAMRRAWMRDIDAERRS